VRLRSLSVAALAAVVLVPVSASAAVAAEPTSSGITGTFRDSGDKRAKRLARAVPTTVSAPRSAPAPTAPTAPTVAPVVSYSDRVLALTNAERTARGLRPLAFSTCADGYANTWAATLARVGSLSHQALSPILTACKARGVGENVAYGNVTPEQLVKMWMDSPGHRANILNPAFTHLGVGDVKTSTGRVYGVQVFLTL
jgi:uncharacterized protein YkwD